MSNAVDASQGEEAADEEFDFAFIGRMAGTEHPLEAARRWASETLAAAGWPPDAQRSPVAWAEAEGHAPRSPVMEAANMVEMLDAGERLVRMLAPGRPGASQRAAISFIFSAGAVWGEVQGGELAAIGGRVLLGLRKARLASGERMERRGRVVVENARLLAENPTMPRRARARAIAEAIGAPVASVHILLRRLEAKATRKEG